MAEIHDFIRMRPGLVWYSKDYDNFSDETIVESVLNYGDWDDFKEMLRILGIRRVAEIFRAHAFRVRTNYFPDVRRYFKLYFDKHVPTSVRNTAPGHSWLGFLLWWLRSAGMLFRREREWMTYATNKPCQPRLCG